MHSKPSGHPKNEVSDREIAAYARSPKEWRERYLSGMPIRQPPDNPETSRMDEAMLAAARSSRRLTGFGQKTLLIGVLAWLSLKFFHP